MCNNNIGEDEEEIEILKFLDEDGNAYEFEVLDTVELYSREFVVLSPTFERPAELKGLVHIYEVIEELDSDTDTYVGLEEPELIEEVFAKFMKRHNEEFTFSD